jgi:hypothetical protein
MRFSTAFVAAALIPLSLAAPINHQRGLKEILGAVGDAIKNPKLTKSRLDVASGLKQTMGSLQDVAESADETNNDGIAPLVQDAMNGVSAAQGGVKNIAKAIFSGTTPKIEDQTTVAQGIVKAQTAISQMAAAVKTADASLSDDIEQAQAGIAKAADGGKGVLESQNLGFSDVGLTNDGTAIAGQDGAAPKGQNGANGANGANGNNGANTGAVDTGKGANAGNAGAAGKGATNADSQSTGANSDNGAAGTNADTGATNSDNGVGVDKGANSDNGAADTGANASNGTGPDPSSNTSSPVGVDSAAKSLKGANRNSRFKNRL